MENAYLEPLLKEGQVTTANIQAEFGGLTKPQLNWKPTDEVWSIGQCLDHLIVSNKRYFNSFKGIANGTKKPNFWERLPVGNFWGNMIRKSVHPDTIKKAKTPDIFKPSSSDIRDDIVQELAYNFEELKRLVRFTDSADHERTMISSPAAAFITYSLKDACIILITHLERHYRQAKAVKEVEGFPLFVEVN